MVLSTAPGLARRWRSARQAALVLLSLTVAHHVVYLVRYGRAIETQMHGDHAYWPLLLVGAAGAALVVGGWWAWRLTFGARAASVAPPEAPEAPRGMLAEWLAIFGRLLLMVAAAFLVLENVEHLLGHGHLEGLRVYWAPGAELTFPALVAVVAGIALLGALVRWREVALIARLRARRLLGRHRRPPRMLLAPRWRVTAALIRHQLLAADDDRGRAPPARAATQTA